MFCCLATSSASSSAGSTIYVLLDVSDNKTIRGKYSINLTTATGQGTGWIILDNDRLWPADDTDIPTRGTLKAFFSNIGTTNYYGNSEARVAYTRMMMFFLIIFMIFGFLSYTTGWDVQTQGGALLLLVPLVWIASAGGMFNIPYDLGTPQALAQGGFLQKYTVALLASMFGGGYLFSEMAKRRVI